MTRKLEGKIALITGGSRGIGAAIAKRLAAEGTKIALTYSKGADAAGSVVKEIERAGGKAIAIQADATNADAGKAAVEKDRGDLWAPRYPGKQCRHCHSENVRRDDAGRDGSRARR